MSLQQRILDLVTAIGADTKRHDMIPRNRLYRSGYYYGLIPGAGASTLATTLNRMYLMPFWVPQTVTFNQHAIEVTTAGATGALLRTGIYSSDANDEPSTLLIDEGTSVATAVAVLTKTINLTLQPGIYWHAAVSQGAVCTVRANAATNTPPIAVSSLADASNTASSCWFWTAISGALPATVAVTPANQLGPSPRLLLRAA